MISIKIIHTICSIFLFENLHIEIKMFFFNTMPQIEFFKQLNRTD